VRALLGDQRDQLTDLSVVDGVIDRVRNRGVGLTDVQPQVENQPLADLPLGLADAVMGVQRKAADLDRDRLGGLLALLVEVVAVA